MFDTILEKFYIGPKGIKKFNNGVKRDIEINKRDVIPLDFIENLYIKILNNKNFSQRSPICCEVPVKRTTMIKIVLDFFQSLDSEFYEKAKKILLNVDDTVSISIFTKENPAQYGSFSKDESGKSKVFIPTRKLPDDTKDFDADFCTSTDVFTLVHEIAHTFDFNDKYSVPKIDCTDGLMYRRNYARDIFCEATSLTFEALFSEYLIKNNIFTKEVIKSNYDDFSNSLHFYIQMMYCRIQFLKEYKKNGVVTEKFLNELIESENIDLQTMQKIIYITASQSFMGRRGDFTYSNRYAMGRVLSATIVQNYKKYGVSALKDYMNIIKENKTNDVFKFLNISVDQQGITTILNNMILQDKYIYGLLENPKYKIGIMDKLKSFLNNSKFIHMISSFAPKKIKALPEPRTKQNHSDFVDELSNFEDPDLTLLDAKRKHDAKQDKSKIYIQGR